MQAADKPFPDFDWLVGTKIQILVGIGEVPVNSNIQGSTRQPAMRGEVPRECPKVEMVIQPPSFVILLSHHPQQNSGGVVLVLHIPPSLERCGEESRAALQRGKDH